MVQHRLGWQYTIHQNESRWFKKIQVVTRQRKCWQCYHCHSNISFQILRWAQEVVYGKINDWVHLKNWVRYKFMSQKKTTGDYYSNGEKNSCTYLKLKRNKKYYNYVNEIQDIKLTYHRNSLDLFGIQPGLELYDRKLSSSDEDW